MKCRAEINRFAVFLFCSLVLLGSLAPTATSEESTPGQMQKRFTTRLKPLASLIERRASDLLKNYNACIHVMDRNDCCLTADSQVKDMVNKIPECPVFDADCCFLHIFYNLLQNLRSDIKLLCATNHIPFVEVNINQLNTTLRERAALYTCKNEDLPQMDRQIQEMEMAKKVMFILQVFQKYKQLMENATKMNS